MNERLSDEVRVGPCPERHRLRTFHALAHRGGIPYEIERTVCAVCGKLIGERRLRRAEA